MHGHRAKRKKKKRDLPLMRMPIRKEKAQKTGIHWAEIFPALLLFIFCMSA
jgi:hypothetical protein